MLYATLGLPFLSCRPLPPASLPQEECRLTGAAPRPDGEVAVLRCEICARERTVHATYQCLCLSVPQNLRCRDEHSRTVRAAGTRMTCCTSALAGKVWGTSAARDVGTLLRMSAAMPGQM